MGEAIWLHYSDWRGRKGALNIALLKERAPLVPLILLSCEILIVPGSVWMSFAGGQFVLPRSVKKGLSFALY